MIDISFYLFIKKNCRTTHSPISCNILTNPRAEMLFICKIYTSNS